MNILVISCGSATLKLQIVNSDDKSRLAWGLVDRIGQDGSVEFESADSERLVEQRSIADHGEAAGWRRSGPVLLAQLMQ